MNQATIKQAFQFEGKGLHHAKIAKVNVLPADVNHGIVFKRVDLDEAPLIKANANNVTCTDRSTTLSNKDCKVVTVEHLLSALYASGVTNALIEIDQEELPILDGSSSAFMEMIEKAEIVEQSEDKERFILDEVLEWIDEESGAEFILIPAENLEITTLVEFSSSNLGSQFAVMSGLDAYASEISSARTFVLLSDLEKLADANLIKGGDLQNAVVYADQDMKAADLKKLAEKLNYEGSIEIKDGIVNTSGLRLRNEAARHKLLDLIGDLALTGLELPVKIVAKKPGHGANTRLAKKILELQKANRKKAGIPKYDPNKEPVNDIHVIMKKLQHRFPFLLVDKIIELSDKHVVGVKNVTMNEPFFPGHFPDNPVMPGVLQIEAMAQTGGILVMENVDDPHEYDTYFLRIKNALFRHPVLPGDTILFKMELISPIRRGLCEMTGKAYVGDKLVCEAELLAQIIKR